MRKNANIISKFSKHLFWDVDISELDINTHSKYIISKVLQYGNYSDWKILTACYGIDNIVKKAQSIRELDKRTATFLSVIGNVPKTNFQCYSTKQSIPKHWAF
jgi:hypothetical protein